MRGVLVASTLLLLTNIAFLGWALRVGQQLRQPLPEPLAPLSEDDLSATLAGMPGYDGTAPCIELARFIAAMNLALDSAGASPPLPDPPLTPPRGRPAQRGPGVVRRAGSPEPPTPAPDLNFAGAGVLGRLREEVAAAVVLPHRRPLVFHQDRVESG